MRSVKEDPPSFMNIIKAALMANPVTSAPTLLAGAAVREGKERLAENLRPMGYDRFDNPRGEKYDRAKHIVTPEKRILQALMGKSEYSESEKSNPSEDMQERQSLFKTVLGLEGGTLPPSDYMEGAYRSPVTERNLLMVLNDPTKYYSRGSNTPPSGQTLKSVIDSMTSEPAYHGPDVFNYDTENVLGNFTVNRGSDERGDYVEYYDEWDLNPFSDQYTSNSRDVRGLEDFLYDDVFGLKSPKIYGRIYMDELKDKGQDIPKLLRYLSQDQSSFD